MDIISLPVIPNSPINVADSTKEGLFQLKTFGSFNFIQNVAFNPLLIEYDENYQNDQSNSELFKTHMIDVYSNLKSNFPKGSKLVEVGCGKGAFLKIVREDGYFDYSGFDTAYEGGDEKIHSRYLAEKDNVDADVVVLRHTLEHIQSPHLFLKFLKGVFSEDASIFIEVPQFAWIEKNKVLIDFTYEHVNYFSTKSLCSLFSNVLSFGDFFGGQYQFCLASLGSLQDSEWKDFALKNKWLDFSFAEYIDAFRLNIQLLSNKQRIWIWGGGN